MNLFLAAGLFALGCDDYIIAGLLSNVGATFHSSIESVAQGITIYGITYVGAMPLCVFLLTKQRVQQVLLLALLTFTVGNLVTLASTNVFLFILGRAITGIGAGLYLPLAIATAGELVKPEAKGKALSFAWGANAAGAVIGIPIGLWLEEKTNWRMTIAMIIAMSAIAIAGLAIKSLKLKVTAPPSLRDQARLLIDRDVMSVIAVTLLTATGGLGLYVYTSSVLEGSVTSAPAAFSLWNIGGLIGSIAIGYVVDRFPKPQWVLAAVLMIQMIAFASIPTVKSMPILGLIPFFVWGAMGWSMMTPQQYRLSQLKPGHDSTLVALHSSAVSLGAVTGPALGGLALASGFNAEYLPYATTCLAFCALTLQMFLIHKNRVQTVLA